MRTMVTVVALRNPTASFTGTAQAVPHSMKPSLLATPITPASLSTSPSVAHGRHLFQRQHLQVHRGERDMESGLDYVSARHYNRAWGPVYVQRFPERLTT